MMSYLKTLYQGLTLGAYYSQVAGKHSGTDLQEAMAVAMRLTNPTKPEPVEIYEVERLAA
jgi:hypothetical protein